MARVEGSEELAEALARLNNQPGQAVAFKRVARDMLRCSPGSASTVMAADRQKTMYANTPTIKAKGRVETEEEYNRRVNEQNNEGDPIGGDCLEGTIRRLEEAHRPLQIWGAPDACLNCGGPLVGDGYSVARHCESVDVGDKTPDDGPCFCEEEEEEGPEDEDQGLAYARVPAPPHMAESYGKFRADIMDKVCEEMAIPKHLVEGTSEYEPDITVKVDGKRLEVEMPIVLAGRIEPDRTGDYINAGSDNIHD